ncbi:MAG: acetyl-CoA synthase subunit gamma [bacterium]|nr:acetyl-CoA synthase subunit gamma [bacterium]
MDGTQTSPPARDAERADPAADCGCCSASRPANPPAPPPDESPPWIIGTRATPIGKVTRVSTTLTRTDRIGTWKARWAIGRMNYQVPPGLYAVGDPTPDSPVLVSANYKLSFDHLRTQLGSLDAWILVLDTRGINVWCAAGKGTFGTDEIVTRLKTTRLDEVVSHRRLVVPQLGAPGIAGHEVARRSGFRVVYGPVRAADVPEFLNAGQKTTPEMRRVRFPLRDRLVLIPVELVMGAKYALPFALGFILLAGLGPGLYSVERVVGVGLPSAAMFLAVCVAAVVLTPTLLPWLPSRAFAAKGFWVGLAIVIILGALARFKAEAFGDGWSVAGWVLIVLAVTSFAAMNYTGVSTYTSPSGVRREMRVAVPLQVVGGVAGAGLWLAGRFL